MSLSVIPEVKFRPESFGGLAFNPSRALVVELNQVGYEILEKVANKGEISEEEILASFSDIKGRLVLDFIEDLRRSSILENGNGSGSQPLPHKLSTKEVIAEKEINKLTKYLSAPIFVWWDITKACNLKCKQCYSSAGKASPNELTTAEVFSIIEQLSENGLFYIYFLGGEPLMREDFFEILEKCRECSIVTMLSTNGWFVDKEITRKLVEADIQIARVSIDGGTEGIHDTIRGVSGSFKRALKAVSLLKEGGVPNVGVSPTLLPDNYSQKGSPVLPFTYFLNQ